MIVCFQTIDKYILICFSQLFIGMVVFIICQEWKARTGPFSAISSSLQELSIVYVEGENHSQDGQG